MGEQQPSEEQLLARRSASGSEEERRRLLEAILAPYVDRIARWALRVCADPDEAAELAQDTLLSICAHIDQFRGESRFSTWVFTIVLNQRRKRGARAARARETPLHEAPDPAAAGPSPEDAIDRRRRAEQFRRLLDTELTPLEARIFLLHFGDEIPLALLDRELGLTNRSGARAHLTSAKRKLRRKMRYLTKGPRPRGESAPRGLATIKGSDDD